MKKILIINGHPNVNSYCHSLVKAYATGATKAGHQVVILNLIELKFDLNFNGSYTNLIGQSLEADLVFAQEKIKWAEHLVIVHPVWWGSVPALLKGFLDRVLLPGFAFKYRKDSPLWDKLLKGKTANIIYTSDTPNFIYKWFYRAPALTMLGDRTLGFCGIKTVKINAIAPIRKSNKSFRENWLTKIEIQGSKGI